jgi:hypothetical protein
LNLQTLGDAAVRWITSGFGCFAALLLASGVYCWSVMPTASVSRSLAAEVRRGPGTVVDFATVAPFPWDRVFVFHPYTPHSHIDACLGFPWDGAKWSNIEWDEGINLVVFVHNRSVVCWFEHSRADGDMLALAVPNGYTVEDAKFTVRLGQENRLVLAK